MSVQAGAAHVGSADLRALRSGERGRAWGMGTLLTCPGTGRPDAGSARSCRLPRWEDGGSRVPPGVGPAAWFSAGTGDGRPARGGNYGVGFASPWPRTVPTRGRLRVRARRGHLALPSLVSMPERWDSRTTSTDPGDRSRRALSAVATGDMRGARGAELCTGLHIAAHARGRISWAPPGSASSSRPAGLSNTVKSGV